MKVSMQPIKATDSLALSADLVSDNIARIQSIFPEAFAEGKINFEVLKQLLGDSLNEHEEKYGLNWHGKKRARQLALSPSAGTLRPVQSESVQWDETQNLFIEGDNLEVLKLLQKSYSKKIKLIYIDPPYNTGNDFVYPDNFRDSIKNYLELTGQIAGGVAISTNAESSGRFHTDWLNMIYCRLKLARNLLTDDGAIFISIDDHEAPNLRIICDEIFGEDNFVVPILWQKRITPENRRAFSFEHDYVMCYAKSAELFGDTRRLLPLTAEARARYKNPDNDPRGDWQSVPAIAQAGHGTKSQFYKLRSPNGNEFDPPPGCCWRYSEQKMIQEIASNNMWFGSDGNGVPRIKRFLSDTRQGLTPSTLWMAEVAGSNEEAKKELMEIFSGNVVFDSPKPVRLIQRILSIATDPLNEDIVLDFFSGSGTTGHSVFEQNSSDGGNRKFIVVQLPEVLDKSIPGQEAAATFCDKIGKPRTIAELTKERLRRAASSIQEKNSLFSGDAGFRVFKLDSSNILEWDPNRDDLPQSLLDSSSHLKQDRNEQDILFEILLKIGLELTVPITVKKIAEKSVYSIGAGTILVCLAENISSEEVESIALGIVTWHLELAPAGETTLVFRDSAFADDIAKTNLTAILSQHGLGSVRSL